MISNFSKWTYRFWIYNVLITQLLAGCLLRKNEGVIFKDDKIEQEHVNLEETLFGIIEIAHKAEKYNLEILENNLVLAENLKPFAPMEGSAFHCQKHSISKINVQFCSICNLLRLNF